MLERVLLIYSINPHTQTEANYENSKRISS